MKKQKKTSKEYQSFLKIEDTFKPVPEVSIHKHLDPGMYDVQVHPMTGAVSFVPSVPTFDQIVDLPSPTFQAVVKEMEHFISPEVEALFKANGYVYKRSTLLFGAPGTGKTVIVNRVMVKVIEAGGTVLFNPPVNALPEVFRVLDSIQPKTKLLIVFEEFDELIKRGFEKDLLSILDGQLQKSNVVYLATTNFIENIPKRLLRPGRFSTVIEATFPTTEERKFFLDAKLKTSTHLIPRLVQITEGFSIDEVKEVVVAHVCLGQSLDTVVNRILLAKGEDPLLSDKDCSSCMGCYSCIDQPEKDEDDDGFVDI